MSENKNFEMHALVELFGHARIAGRVSEQIIAGQGFIRVDVPATSRKAAFTRLFGPSAIYSITPVDEEIAARLAESIYTPDIVPVGMPQRQLDDPLEDSEGDRF